MTVPIFAQPENVISFPDQSAFIALLERDGIPLREWGDEKIKKLWAEICERDAVYAMGDQFGYPGKLARCIITMALRVTMHHPEYGLLVLIEFRVRDGKLSPRKHNNSSLSEKWLVNPDGTPAEKARQTAIRTLWQEASIRVPQREVNTKTLTFMRWPNQFENYMFGGARHVEHDLKTHATSEKDYRYEPLLTFNQVAHYSLELSPRHYQHEGHQDQETKYLSFWKSVSEWGSLEPKPVVPAISS